VACAWDGVAALQTVKEMQAYLRDKHGIRLSRATIYRYATEPLEMQFIPFPLHPEGRPGRGKGTRGVVGIETVDDWVAARFHVRATPAPATRRSSP